MRAQRLGRLGGRTHNLHRTKSRVAARTQASGSRRPREASPILRGRPFHGPRPDASVGRPTRQRWRLSGEAGADLGGAGFGAADLGAAGFAAAFFAVSAAVVAGFAA